MHLLPENIYQSLEFDHILQDLQSYCLGSPANTYFEKLVPSNDPQMIAKSLQDISEMLEFLELPGDSPIAPYRPLDDAFRLLRVVDAVPEIEDFLELTNQLSQIRRLHLAFQREEVAHLQSMHQLVVTSDPLEELLKQLLKTFDDEGNVLDTASPTLHSIRKNIHSKFRSIDRVFNRELSRFKGQGFLAENPETIRNGRRVLAVLPESKRKIRGIIHDTSSTGRTFFIEPEEVMTLNNELFELHNEEKAEIHKILKQLAQDLRIHLDQLKENLNVLTQVDVVHAKARQAIRLRCEHPNLSANASLSIEEGYHPLLLLKNQGNRGRVIPFSLTLDSKTRMVIISGPNAGGKTVTLKAVGLIQLMVQCGLLVPVGDGSTIGVFDNFCADIGDQQSLQEDLSTYSSHLKNMQSFLQRSNDRSLILLDEFGSGTDPAVGGALAEAILLALHEKNVRGLITTHYSNLKIRASNTSGMSNASMQFDTDNLAPTFHLIAQTPGSSYAFEMARRNGISRKILKRAKSLMGNKGASLEELLSSLKKEKEELNSLVSRVAAKEKGLDKLIRNYEQLRKQLDIRRKKLKLREKTEVIATQNKANQELQKLIEEIRKNEKISEAKALSKKIKDNQKAVSQDIDKIQAAILSEENTQTSRPFKVGDFVQTRLGNLSGKIIKIKKSKATVQTSNILLDAPLRDLLHSQETIERNPVRSVRASLGAQKEIHTKLDLRGLRKDEAAPRIERFIDRALVANLSSVEIIHGKGSGALCRMVHEILADYPQELTILHPEAQQGGDGVTIVKF